MVGGVPTEAAADVPGEIRFTVSGPVAGVVSNIVAAQAGSQQRREPAAQKVIFRVESDAKDECVVVEGQLRAAGVEGVKTTQKIQRYRPMVRDVIADTQAEQGGVRAPNFEKSTVSPNRYWALPYTSHVPFRCQPSSARAGLLPSKSAVANKPTAAVLLLLIVVFMNQCVWLRWICKAQR